MGRRVEIDHLRSRLSGSARGEEQELFAQIAADVVRRRQEWSLSQRELAELCGTTQSAIARLERGSRPPRIDTLWRIANALDCELRVELRPRTEARSEKEDKSQKEGESR